MKVKLFGLCAAKMLMYILIALSTGTVVKKLAVYLVFSAYFSSAG